ncbi:Isoamyl acetate-hydrolyzing esterase 1 -like protein [Echinococcus granulosus]|nr:Isoamyl acetate-hydrolyzing esterase [Echinococcus granulosus]EUB61576.1 Isoamyl acetate-hydrolyzing esterase [Echinococcus granulosus]KAH9280242.1 Isoamyl acetate-hydrolyzing esterase 1 -like protein [Echinococcus granulosus]
MSVCSLPTWPNCIFFGDSITQRGFDEEGCYLSVLASRFQRRADIVGRGFSGYNTRLCLPVLKILFPKPECLQNTSAFFIFLGANDASFESQKVELPEYRSNLSLMITHLTEMELDRSKIFIITPPPVDEIGQEPNHLTPEQPITRTFENTKNYANACVEVAKSDGVTCVNLFEAMAAQKNWKDFLIDGLHFAKPGGVFCAEILGTLLDSILPSKQNFPDWKYALELDLCKPFPLH